MQDTGLFSVFSGERREKTWLRTTNFQEEKKSYGGGKSVGNSHGAVHKCGGKRGKTVGFVFNPLFLTHPHPPFPEPCQQFCSEACGFPIRARPGLGAGASCFLLLEPRGAGPGQGLGFGVPVGYPASAGAWSVKCGVITSLPELPSQALAFFCKRRS